jgi:hypothetical protein
MPDDARANEVEDEVPLHQLEHSGTDALQAALELRGPLEDGIVSGEPVGPILDEIFDLIRLGMA